jgi:crotonobetainyl-CoA:carnitine CoA-transferase CaiB-like acyl-CoA transferase
VVGDLWWTRESRFATVTGRLENAEELDRLVSTWALDQEAEEVVDRLKRSGIAAALVRNLEDLMSRDAHMRARRFFRETRTPAGHKIRLDGVPYKHSATPGRVRRRAPLLGEHTVKVLRNILGLSRGEIAQLRSEGVLR